MEEERTILPQEDTFELENRIRNLMWTVSGDYQLDIPVDAEAFRRNRYLALYDAVKQGAFSRYFDREALLEEYRRQAREELDLIA